MFIKIYAVLAVVIEFFTVLLNDSVKGVKDFWIPIVLFVALFLGLLAFHMIALLIMSFFIDKSKPCERPNRFCKFMVDHTVEAVLTVARVKVNVEGLEKIPTDRRFLLVSNHRSNLDPMICIVKLMNYGMAFVSKPENFKIVIAGAFTHKCCYLPIDRENARNAMKTLHKATDLVKNDICSVGIYPEGTRSKTGELLEFKDGVFYIAKKAECPIVVITVENTEKIASNFPFKKTVVNMKVLDCIYPEAFADKNTHVISDEVRQIMLNELKH